MNVSVLAFGLVILISSIVVLTNANPSNEDSSTEISNPADKVRVSRRTHCGVRTFKLLMVICNNDFKFPPERQAIRGKN